ncbi:MAG: cytochrome c family protein [Novosphingobium sp.]
MDDRTNTTSGWVLFSGIVALGLSSLSAHHFMADKNERPEKMGYEIAGVVREGGEGAAAETPIEARLAASDPAKGANTFKKCTSCHTDTAGGPGGIGPNLYGIVGRAIASGSFAYSDDLKKVGGKWDWASLDHWLKHPKSMAAGTKMTFAGLEDGADRANVIAYLNTQGSNLPLPAAPAAAPAADAKGAAPAAGAPAGAPAAPAAK